MINGKKYVGQSIDPEHRFISHCSRAKNDSDNSPIHSAIGKYGKDNFKLDVVEWTEQYNDRERYWIKELNSKSPNGYNVTDGGEEPPHAYGENHHNSVVTEHQVDIIIQQLKDGILTEPEIGKLFSPPVNQTLINNINWGVTHKRESEDYPIRSNCPYNLTE